MKNKPGHREGAGFFFIHAVTERTLPALTAFQSAAARWRDFGS